MIGRLNLIKIAMFVAAVVAAWGILSLGTATVGPELEVGEPAPQRYEAQRSEIVVDVVETERLKQEARDSVLPVQRVHPEIEAEVIDQISAVFDDVESLVVADAPATPPTPLPPPPEVARPHALHLLSQLERGARPQQQQCRSRRSS